MGVSQLTQEEVIDAAGVPELDATMEEGDGGRWVYNKNGSPVYVYGDVDGDGDDEGQVGVSERIGAGEGPDEGVGFDDDCLDQSSDSDYQAEGELEGEGEDDDDLDSDEFEEEDVAAKAKEEDNIMAGVSGEANGPTFIDSDYDLSDKEEDNIMAAQVEGWKHVVETMRIIGDGDEIDSSDNLPSDSPSSDGDEDDLAGEGDIDIPQVVSRRYKPATDINDPKWEVRLRFNSKDDFKELIRHEGVKMGKKLRLLKNDKIRCIAVCRGLERSKKHRGGCPWKVTLTYRSGLGCWQISRMRATHKCGGATYTHGCANAKYLSKYFKEDMRIFPGMTVSQFVEKVHSELKINISAGKAQRAMAHARRMIEGDVIKQYKRLHDYKAEILRTNPGSTVVLATRRLSDGKEKFTGIYVAYEACKTSFKQHCRRIVGLDGCHLKGQGKGILLTAIGLDPNDQIFPIAFAVVAVESTETWSWFLRFLVQDLEIKDSSKWTFISDRQKGLINAVRSCCHMAEHRFCVWHMHNNFRKVFTSTKLKDKISEAARATHEYAFDNAMKEIKELNSAAHKWLTVHTAKESWSRAFFGFEAKCDILVNNISECYNRVLLFARDKPLYGMLECIRMYLMDRFTSRRKMAAKLEDCVGPKIRKKIEKLKDKVGECMVPEAGEWVYQVNTKFKEQFVVDLRERTCSCRRWMLTGLPCQHACAAIQLTSETVESFIPKCYSTETFKQVYATVVYPVHGPELW